MGMEEGGSKGTRREGERSRKERGRGMVSKGSGKGREAPAAPSPPICRLSEKERMDGGR